MKFSEYPFSDEIKRNLEIMGFKKPTDIQYKSIYPIIRGEDLLAIAQTGTGKTAAFGIPIVNKLHESHKKGENKRIKAIIMVPTRELALQLTKVFNQISLKTRVKTVCIYGGVDQEPQIKKLLKGADILIATPGRTFDLVHQGFINLKRIETLVLDEADHMLDLGFIDDIRDLIKLLPENRQTLFFSATINKQIKRLAYSLVKKNAIRIQISPKDPVSKNIKHSVCFVEMDDKRFFLERLVKENPDKKILVFVRTRVRAERVAKAMARLNITALTIHGDKGQKDRFKSLNAFRKNEVRILIATDVTARGIDIPDVQFVVNYDLPEIAENYVHRIGRTGRGKNKGDAVSFCSKQEKILLKEIEEFIGKPIKVIEIQRNEYQETIDFSEDISLSVKELMGQIKDIEDKISKRKNRKGKKK